MRFVFYTAISSILFCALPAQAQLLTGYDEPAPTTSKPEKRILTAPAEPVSQPQPKPVLSSEDVDVFVRTPEKTPAGQEMKFALAKSQASSAPQKEVGYKPLMTGHSGSETKTGEDAPVDLQADQMTRDEERNVVSASGDVMIVQDGRILRADKVLYDLNEDQVRAKGYVVLNEENGDIHLVDKALYSNRLRDGHVTNLRTVLNDGSRFTADEGEHKGGVETTMHGASYTPCAPCKKDPERAPVWGIKASEVTHDQEERRVSYKHARFETFGVPVFYTPYFAHPDGTIKQKSGFLAPSLGYRSELGAFVEGKYYWAIAPDQDATVGLMVMTDQDPLGTLEYRKRWEDAYFEISGGITSSDRTDRSAGRDIDEEEEERGHVFAEGLWNINNKWRTGLNVNWTSDDQYMRTYDFTNDNVLENEIYAERFSGRNYLGARLLAFQDIRIREIPIDQPNVLPEIVANFKGEPGAVPFVKGQWEVDASVLGLQRDDDEQDMQRASLSAGWKRRLVSDYGLLTSVDASVRGDAYHITDRLAATPGSGRSKAATEVRAFPQFHMQSSYPMAKQFETMQARIEPLVALTAAPNISDEDGIPNEDSNGVQIDSSNLFEPNRFPGLDRIEDESRVTYGMRTGLFADDGSFGDVFLGQSYRFSEDDNPFPQGSGLDEQSSDIVGQVSGSYKNTYDLNYRFQLDDQTLAAQRHELDARADWNRFRLSTRYLFASALEGTDITENREQLQGDAQFYLTEEWRTRFGARQDLGQNPGLRRAYVGLDYLGQCLFWSLTGRRNLTSDASGESSTEVLFRIGLKNLGEFEESSLRPAVENE